MKHKLKISVSKQPDSCAVFACQQKTVREKLLRFLLGSPVRLTVLVPGDSVDEVSIKEEAGGDDESE